MGDCPDAVRSSLWTICWDENKTEEVLVMAVTTFAAIYIGSYEVSLKIFEISPRKRLKKIDYIRSRVELGKDAYTQDTIGYELVEELCKVLKEFRRIMDGYKVEAYAAFAGSVLRNVSNAPFILDQIRLRTKIQVQVLSNSEHRFISYMSLAFRPVFEQMIQEGAAVVDVGGGSMQITLFQKGKAKTTQQIVLGTMRIREKLSGIEAMVAHYETQIQEMVDKELEIFKNLYLPIKKGIKYVIVMGDYLDELMKGVERRTTDGAIETERFIKALKKLQKKNASEISSELNLPNEHDPLIIPSIVLFKRLAEEIDADYIWVSGTNISDGIAYDYAQKSRILKPEHSFEEDVLSSARFLAERYQSYSRHTEALVEMTTTIFDALKGVHGLSKRERLLLQAAALLHDCGSYISRVNQSECSYQIIMASEIIGLTHQERQIIACVVRYASNPLVSYEEIMDKVDATGYMVVAKLAAILKIANAMDRSHKQKFKNIKAVLKEKQLLITIESRESILLEKELFSVYADAFERVFSVKPCIREKRVLN